MYFYDLLLHENLKITACLNQVCRVRNTILMLFVRYCVNDGFKIV